MRCNAGQQVETGGSGYNTDDGSLEDLVLREVKPGQPQIPILSSNETDLGVLPDTARSGRGRRSKSAAGLSHQTRFAHAPSLDDDTHPGTVLRGSVELETESWKDANCEEGAAESAAEAT